MVRSRRCESVNKGMQDVAKKLVLSGLGKYAVSRVLSATAPGPSGPMISPDPCRYYTGGDTVCWMALSALLDTAASALLHHSKNSPEVVQAVSDDPEELEDMDDDTEDYVVHTVLAIGSHPQPRQPLAK
ncbi:hypothetical protein NDU88_001933 [Pleurodeles waltl]|uniref:Uncharacterized protein n=1 Tax=Pleurodeles waltl TaxID=8319 RepID=A0AAV7P6X3_PLEWA|nr:hypothetical protein NDU88_001933 [Pleurodeles waltl]